VLHCHEVLIGQMYAFFVISACLIFHNWRLDMTAQFKKRTGGKMGGGFAAAHFPPLFLHQAAGSFRM